MWFPLKEKYSFAEEEIDPDSLFGKQGVIGLKKGAPIKLLDGLPFGIYLCYQTVILKGLTIEDLVLPKQCVIDEKGEIFCLDSKVLVAVAHRLYRVRYCPSCGSKISSIPSFPENPKRYEIRKP